MSTAVTRGQTRTMAREAWSILNEISTLRRAAIRSGHEDEADELERCMRSFWFYSLFDSCRCRTLAI